MQKPSQRISLRTPRPSTEKARHIFSVPTANTTPKSQRVKISHTLIHTHAHFSHTTAHIRNPYPQKRAYLHAFTEDIYTQQPQAHTQHCFSIPASVRSVHAHEGMLPKTIFAFRGSGRKGTGGFCMHSRRTDIHIPSSHRRRFQKYYVSNPLFLIISTCNIEVNACNNTYPHEDE